MTGILSRRALVAGLPWMLAACRAKVDLTGVDRFHIVNLCRVCDATMVQFWGQIGVAPAKMPSAPDGDGIIFIPHAKFSQLIVGLTTGNHTLAGGESSLDRLGERIGAIFYRGTVEQAACVLSPQELHDLFWVLFGCKNC